jgi:hypothetical protein
MREFFFIAPHSIAFLNKASIRRGKLDGGVDRWVRGETNASDHAPVWIMLDL